MKQFKQLGALFLAFTMAIGLLSTPAVAYADTEKTTLNPDSVTIDYVDEELVVPITAGAVIYYTTKYNDKNPASTKWEEAYVSVPTATKASIDFSSINGSKEAEIFITDDVTKEPASVKLKAQEKNLVVAFSGLANTTNTSKFKVVADWTGINQLTEGYQNAGVTTGNAWAYGFLCAGIKGTDGIAALSTEDAENYLQFRKGTTGDWKSIVELDVRKYAAYGASLYFRIAPTVTTTISTGSALKNLGRASKEVKVTYSKQANAPKISIKGDTKLISLTKAQEYRVGTVTGGSVSYGDWISVQDNHMEVGAKKVTPTYLEDLLLSSGNAWKYSEAAAGQTIQLRVAATDKAIASKITTYTLNAVQPPVVTDDGLKIELVKEFSYKDGIKITNNYDKAVQVAVVSGTSYNVNDSKTVKWTTITGKTDKGAKSTTLKGATLALGDTIIYRFATIKDDTKTVEDEFVVASAAVPYKYKEELPLSIQQISYSSLTLTEGTDIATASGSAITTGQSLLVVNATTAGAVELTVNVDCVNITNGKSAIVKRVTALDGTTVDTNTSTITVVGDGSFTTTTGKLKVAITGTKDETAIFWISVDECNYYLKVQYTQQA